jgi:hypothetical protein
MNKLAKALRSDFTAVVPLEIAAEAVRRAGRGRDTILAHITPREAAMLKRRGGSGSINPRTGLLEFQEYADPYNYDEYAGSTASYLDQPDYQPDVRFPEMTQEDYAASADYQPGGLSLGGGAEPSQEYDYYSGSAANLPSYSYGGDQPSAFEAERGIAPELYAPYAEGRPEVPEAERPNMIRRALESLGITPREAIQAGTGLGGILTSRRAGEQARKLEQQLAPGARETLARGQQLTAQAERGELTPASQRRMDILRAQAAQRAARTGGVGAAQTAIQLESARQTELQRQATYGQSLQQIGDQSLRRALELSLKADQEGAETAQKYFAALGQMVGGTRGLIGG